jgi:hypothetical protein
MVGLPRESRISRALILAMLVCAIPATHYTNFHAASNAVFEGIIDP